MQIHIFKFELSWSSYSTFGTHPSSEVYLANPSQLQVGAMSFEMDFQFVNAELFILRESVEPV